MKRWNVKIQLNPLRVITYIVIVTFLTQNLSWAKGPTMLTPDNKRILSGIVEILGLDPSEPWRMFGDPSLINTAVSSLKPQERARLVRFLQENIDNNLPENVRLIFARLLQSQIDILITGGTICMSSRPARSFGGQKRNIEELTGPFGKKISSIIRVLPKPKDSSDLGCKDIIQLVKVMKGRVKPLVITHGTDLLAETGLALSLFFQKHKQPIVLAASFDTIDQPDSDASSNMRDAVNLASDPFTPPFVYVVISGEIHLASRIVKTDTKKGGIQSFGESVGEIKEGRIKFSPAFLRWARDFKPKHALVPDLGYAEIMYSNTHTPLEIYESAVNRLLNIRDKVGLVIEGEIQNDEKVLDRLKRLSGHGIPIYAEKAPFSRCTWINKIPSGLSIMKSRGKLAILLGQGLSLRKIKEKMEEDISGEIVIDPGFIRSPRPEHNIYENPRNHSSFIIAFQDMDPDIFRDEIKRLHKKRKKDPSKGMEMVIEGHGDGHIQRRYIKILKEAVESGIQVVMLTNAKNACTNLDKYPIGRELKNAGVIGVPLPGRTWISIPSGQRLCKLGVTDFTDQGILSLSPGLKRWMARELKRMKIRPSQLFIIVSNLRIKVNRTSGIIEEITDGDSVEIYREGRFQRNRRFDISQAEKLPVLRYMVYPIYGGHGLRKGVLTQKEEEYRDYFIAKPLREAFQRIMDERRYIIPARKLWLLVHKISNILIRLQEASLRELANKGIIPEDVLVRLLDRMPLPIDQLARNLYSMISDYYKSGFSKSVQMAILARFIPVTDLGLFMRKHKISLSDAVGILSKYTWSEPNPDNAVALADRLKDRYGISRSDALYFVYTYANPEETLENKIELAGQMHGRHRILKWKVVKIERARRYQEEECEVPFSDAFYFAKKYKKDDAEKKFAEALKIAKGFMETFDVSYTVAMHYLKTYGEDKALGKLEAALEKAGEIEPKVNRNRENGKKISISDIMFFITRYGVYGIIGRIRKVLRDIDTMMEEHGLSYRDAMRIAKGETRLNEPPDAQKPPKQHHSFVLFGLSPAFISMLGFVSALLWTEYGGWWRFRKEIVEYVRLRLHMSAVFLMKVIDASVLSYIAQLRTRSKSLIEWLSRSPNSMAFYIPSLYSTGQIKTLMVRDNTTAIANETLHHNPAFASDSDKKNPITRAWNRFIEAFEINLLLLSVQNILFITYIKILSGLVESVKEETRKTPQVGISRREFVRNTGILALGVTVFSQLACGVRPLLHKPSPVEPPAFIEPKRTLSQLEKEVIEELKLLALDIKDPQSRRYAVNFVNGFIRNGRLLTDPEEIASLGMYGVTARHHPLEDKIYLNYLELKSRHPHPVLVQGFMVHEGGRLEKAWEKLIPPFLMGITRESVNDIISRGEIDKKALESLMLFVSQKYVEGKEQDEASRRAIEYLRNLGKGGYLDEIHRVFTGLRKTAKLVQERYPLDKCWDTASVRDMTKGIGWVKEFWRDAPMLELECRTDRFECSHSVFVRDWLEEDGIKARTWLVDIPKRYLDGDFRAVDGKTGHVVNLIEIGDPSPTDKLSPIRIVMGITPLDRLYGLYPYGVINHTDCETHIINEGREIDPQRDEILRQRLDSPFVHLVLNGYEEHNPLYPTFSTIVVNVHEDIYTIFVRSALYRLEGIAGMELPAGAIAIMLRKDKVGMAAKEVEKFLQEDPALMSLSGKELDILKRWQANGWLRFAGGHYIEGLTPEIKDAIDEGLKTALQDVFRIIYKLANLKEGVITVGRTGMVKKIYPDLVERIVDICPAWRPISIEDLCSIMTTGRIPLDWPGLVSAMRADGIIDEADFRLITAIGEAVDKAAEGIGLTVNDKALLTEVIAIRYLLSNAGELRNRLNSLGYGSKADRIIFLLRGIKKSKPRHRTDYDFIKGLEKLTGYELDDSGLNLADIRGNGENHLTRHWLGIFELNLKQWGVLELVDKKKPKGIIVQDIKDLGAGVQNWLEGIKRYNIDMSGVKMAYVTDDISDADRERLMAVKPANVILVQGIKELHSQGENIVYLASRERLAPYKGQGLRLVERGHAGPVIELSWCLLMLAADDIGNAYKQFVDKLVSSGLITKEQIQELEDPFYIRLPKAEKVLEMWDELQEGSSYLDIWA